LIIDYRFIIENIDMVIIEMVNPTRNKSCRVILEIMFFIFIYLMDRSLRIRFVYLCSYSSQSLRFISAILADVFFIVLVMLLADFCVAWSSYLYLEPFIFTYCGSLFLDLEGADFLLPLVLNSITAALLIFNMIAEVSVTLQSTCP
jgi:hypothetical protein